MKATLNGVTVEGTPDEVWRLIQAAGTNLKPDQPMPDWSGPWWGIFPPDTIVPRVTCTGTAYTPDRLKWPQSISMN